MKKTSKILTIGLVLIVFLISVSSMFAVRMPVNIVYDANNVTNDAVKTKANSIMTTFVFLVQVACVVTVIVMGLRYMLTAAEGKANVKKDLVVWCIGAFIVFCATTLVGLVLEVVTGDEYVTVTPGNNNANNGGNNGNNQAGSSQNNNQVSNWASDYWDNAKNAGLIPSSIINKPGATISRVEFTESIYLLAEKYNVTLVEPSSGIGVSDSGLTNSQKETILKLYNAGIVSGTGKDENGDIQYSPDANITRQDVAAIIYRLLQKSGKTNGTNITESDRNDSLYDGVAEYAKEAMIYMNKNDIIVGTGNGNLDPEGNTTCEQAIAILWRIYSGEE